MTKPEFTLPRLTGEDAARIRKDLGLTQSQLADLFDFKPGTGERAIRRWEKEQPTLTAGLSLLWLRDNYRV